MFKFLVAVSVSPNSSLPVTNALNTLIGGLETIALLGCVGAIVVGGVIWAAGSRSGNYGGAHRGREMVLYGLLGAALIGGAAALVNWATGIGAGL